MGLCSFQHFRQVQNRWEPSLLAKALVLKHRGRLTHRNRGQAHFYNGFVFIPAFQTGTKPVGVELAREGVGPETSRETDTPQSRASLAPTMDLCSFQHFRQVQNRWEPSLLAKALVLKHRGRLTHRNRGQAHFYNGFVFIPAFQTGTKPVGAELAREGVGPETSRETDTPQSRASPLLQWVCVHSSISDRYKTGGSRACSRRRWS